MFLLFLCVCSDTAFRSGPSSMLELQQRDEEDDDIGENSLCAIYFKSAMCNFCTTKWICKNKFIKYSQALKLIRPDELMLLCCASKTNIDLKVPQNHVFTLVKEM